MVRSIFVVLFFATMVGCTENYGDIISDVGQNEEVNVPKSRYYADHENRNGDSSRAEEVLERGLLSTVSCDLWIYYANIKRVS